MKLDNAEQTDRVLVRCEYVAAILMTLCAIIFHVRVLVYMGPLWRDEINGLNVALMSTLKEIWRSIIYYPFPIFHDLVLRLWIGLGFGSTDFQLRILPFLIAMLSLVALWVSCRMIAKGRAPVWPFAVLALNPIVIQNGDWLRPYALAITFISLTFALVWRLTFEDHSARVLLLAIAAAVLSVQTVFQNAVLVFAICTAGMAASACARRWARAALILVVGLIAALSLVPYTSVLRQAHDWTAVVRTDHTVGQIVLFGIGVLTNHNPVVVICWLVILGIAITAATLIRSDDSDQSDDTGAAAQHLLFGITSLIISAAGMVAFISASGWLMDRYFLPFATVAAFCVYTFEVAAGKRTLVRLTSLFVSMVIAGIFVPRAYALSAARATDCDLIAQKLMYEAGQSDLVLLTSFTYGIGFSRYYHGPATWRTIPEVQDHSQHRWDQALAAIRQPDPMRDTFGRIETTLRAGHKIFLVGALPPANAISHDAGHVWDDESLRKQLGDFLRQHVLSSAQLPVAAEDQAVNELEDLPLFMGAGWRESPEPADLQPNDR